MKTLMAIGLILSTTLLSAQPVYWRGHAVDSIIIQAHSASELHDHPRFTTLGKAEQLPIAYDSLQQVYLITRHFRDHYEASAEPDTLVVQGQVFPENLVHPISSSTLAQLMEALAQSLSPAEIAASLDSSALYEQLSDWQLLRHSHPWESFYYLSMKHLAKKEGIPSLQDYHSVDSIALYCQDRFNMSGYVMSSTRARFNIWIETADGSFRFEGKYPNPLNQPWYNFADTNSYGCPVPVLNFDINFALAQILPEGFLRRETLTMEALTQDIINWYLQKVRVNY